VSVEAVEGKKDFWWSREDTAVNFPRQGTREALLKCKLSGEKRLGANNSEYGSRKSRLQRTTWQVEGKWKSFVWQTKNFPIPEYILIQEYPKRTHP